MYNDYLYIYFILIGIYITGCLSRLLKVGDREFFLNGPNIAWFNYGWDYGITSLGYGFNESFWEETFSNVQEYGGNSARIWIYCMGAESPLFDSRGYVVGLNPLLIENLATMLTIANNHRIMVILNMWDFYIYNTSHFDLINDPLKTKSFIDNAMIPMMKGVEHFENLIAWEIMNEADWTVWMFNETVTNIQRFVGMLAEGVHKNSKKNVTVSSSSMKWNSDVPPAEKNYWSDFQLFKAYPSELAYVDFYQVHYYDGWHMWSPFDRNVDYWQLGNKPVLIGETGNTGYYSYQQQFDLGFDNGYAGVMVWAYYSKGAATFDEFKEPMLNFRDHHKIFVDY